MKNDHAINTVSAALYSSEQLLQMSDTERLNVLRECWGCPGDKVEVWGELRESGAADKRFIKLADLRSLRDNSYLEYPGNVA